MGVGVVLVRQRKREDEVRYELGTRQQYHL